jgi:D-amino-acid dehydrogenase
MTAALVEAAVRRGVVHRRGSVTGVRRAGGTLSAVETDDGAITAGALAVCGGAWTPELARRLGVEQLPVSPVRGQIVHLRLEGVDTSAWPIVQPVLSFYMVPWPEGRIAVGATVEPHAGFDARPTAGGLRMLFPEMLRLAPGLADATFLEVRAGLRPVSSDDTPILGELDEAPGVHVATGMGANGLLLGPISGRLVADEILGRAPAIDLAPFRASRFATA